MQFRIENDVLEKYPEAQIGYLTANVEVRKSDPFVEGLKAGLAGHLQGIGINATNFAVHPGIAIWREIYEEDFGVKAKTYRSSIESLLRRIVTGKDLWSICNVVDLYNCCSVYSMLPMGGYDLRKVSGGIRIRLAKEGETFLPLGQWQRVPTSPSHVVYADDQRIICWLWNHKDSAETCIDEETKKVVFFIDGFDRSQVQEAIKSLQENLEKMGCKSLSSGILDKNQPYVELKTS